MIQITFRRVIWRIWRVTKVTDPHGNPLILEDSWLKRDVFSGIKYLGFGLFWYYRCSNDQQIFYI